MRIIQIVENLDRGAVENWLVNLFIESRKYRSQDEWTFYCILGKEGRLDAKVREQGGIIIYSPVDISDKLGFLRALRKTLVNGRYDIIHSHHDYMSGFYLLASLGISFQKRILHVHNTDKGLPTSNRMLNALLLPFFWMISYLMNDRILCISEDVYRHYLGNDWFRKGRVLYYGIELDRFRQKPLTTIRSVLGLDARSKVILFAGRLNDLKNPIFCLDILKRLLNRGANIHLAIVGKGEKEDEVVEKAKVYGITDHVHLMGWRDDIPGMMQSADLFLFPRVEQPKEGLGIVMVEAQSAGLPSLVSRGIVEDVFIIPELIHVVPLLDNAQEWADAAHQIIGMPRIDQSKALASMEASPFSLQNGTVNLLAYYE